MSDMEREDYQKRISELLDAVSTLLDANKAMGEKLEIFLFLIRFNLMSPGR